MTTSRSAPSQTATPQDAPSQPMPPRLAALCRVLQGLLDAGPSLEHALTLTEALDLLRDVDPPFATPDPCSLPPGTGVDIASALDHLDQAVAEAQSVRDVTRYTNVAMLLQQIQRTADP